MTASVLRKEHDLGVWNYKVGRENKEVRLTLVEGTRFSYYKIDSRTGKIEEKDHQLPSSDAIEQAVLKTRIASGKISVLFFPARIDLLDFFIPLTRRVYPLMEGSCLLKSVKLAAAVVADLLTLIVRVVTFLPACAYNKAKAHPLKSEIPFEPEVEAIFVKYQKTWRILSPQAEGFYNSCTLTYHWRVDFYSPLDENFEWEGKTHSLECRRVKRIPDTSTFVNDGFIRNILRNEDDLHNEAAFCYSDPIQSTMGLTPNDFFQIITKDGKKYRRQFEFVLEKLVQDPDVTYL